MKNTQPIPTSTSKYKPVIKRYQELNPNKIETVKKFHKRNPATTDYYIKISDPLSSLKRFLLPNLKNLHHTTSLTLDLSSIKFCTPKHLKSLSIMLKNFKELTSLELIFPNSVEMVPEHITSLGFAFHRMPSLNSLSFKFCPTLRLGFSRLKPFAKLSENLPD